ncbi:hypothetical protein AAC387_Pa03g0859 [Persea americana]
MYYNILLLRGSGGSESEFLWAILPLGYVPLKIGLTQSKRRMSKTQTDLGPGKDLTGRLSLYTFRKWTLLRLSGHKPGWIVLYLDHIVALIPLIFSPLSALASFATLLLHDGTLFFQERQGHLLRQATLLEVVESIITCGPYGHHWPKGKNNG